MSASAFEAFLARIYVDATARRQFLANPHREAQNAGLSEEECETLANIDRLGLELAADSFARKRARSPKTRQKELFILRWTRQLLSKLALA
ncbi:MAG: hypothetical protein AB7G75_12230 [Candidatus Binatia bacterium]